MPERNFATRDHRTRAERDWLALSVLTWLRIAAWLAIAGGVIVFVVGSDWGFFVSLAALVLAGLVLSA